MAQNDSDTTNPSDDELFNSADFESIHLRIAVKNLTTAGDPKKLDEKHLTEVKELGLVLALPANCFIADNHAEIEIATRNSKDQIIKIVLHATAKAAAVHIEDDLSQRVEFKLMQIEPDEWKAFLDIFQLRQNSIEEFFRSQK